MHVCMYMHVEASPVPRSLYTLLIEEDYLAEPRDLQFHLVPGNHFCTHPLTRGCHACLALGWFGDLNSQFSSYL